MKAVLSLVLALGKRDTERRLLFMNDIGIDIHKHYGVLVAIDERGRELTRGRISGNGVAGFAHFFCRLESKGKVVVEAWMCSAVRPSQTADRVIEDELIANS